MEWSRDELATASADVKALMETAGWEWLKKAIEERLRFEQRVMMMSPVNASEAAHERIIGQWAGLRQVGAIAEGIVRSGEKVDRERLAG
jgi:sulfite reductase beta subunit-like hemoprotein